jgi:glucose/arabinose dehydrogenase
MKQAKVLAAILVVALAALGNSQGPAPALTSGLKDARAIAVGGGGKVFVATGGETGKGAVLVVDNGKTVPFATGLDDPGAMAAFRQWLYVSDRQRVWRIDAKGKAEVFVAAEAFPSPPVHLGCLTVDYETGAVYVADQLPNKEAVLYKVSSNPKAKEKKATVSVATDTKHCPALAVPGAIVLDGTSYLLVADAETGKLHRIRFSDSASELVAEGFGAASGLTWDRFGRLYVSDTKNGRVFVIGRPGAKPVSLQDGFQSVAGIALDGPGKSILVLDSKGGSVVPVRAHVPGAEVDDTPLPIEAAVAFPDLKWTGWVGETEKGLPNPLRPVVLTHAGDGSNRIFVGTQHGIIHVFPNDQKAAKTDVFLDIQKKVTYSNQTNEEGFLGLTFHPKYKENGEFFVFYTIKQPKLTNVVCRYRVSKDDPNKANPDSEEEILRFTRPYWNHDGGTICFGPDGYMYIALGDGGLAGDPKGNGQNLNAWLGRILRIDVDHKDPGMTYAVPKDNPLVGKENVRPETWAYGLRNVWRMAFDKKTGKLWAADVGQNLFEEIDIIVKGGNYGWKIREGLHPFDPMPKSPGKDLIEPIWEYHHEVGKSITGGAVYRGPRLPELDGAYIYGDYVSCKIWALRYDDAQKRVVENRPIRDKNVPIFSFGEDQQSEMYLLTSTTSGRGIYWFVRTGEASKK